MKTRLFLSAFLLGSLCMQAQIPNAGFEDWLPNQACQRPDRWYTIFSEFDSSGSFCAVQRSDDHFPPDQGQYSIRIANDTSIWNTDTQPASWLGWGLAFTTHINERPLFAVQGKPKSFKGYYRFQPQNDDTLNLRAFLYHNGQEITGAHFQSSETASDWTFFRIDFNDTNYVAVDSARLILSSANEPKDGSKGPRGNSVLWVDNIGFDYLVSSKPLVRGKQADWEIRVERSSGFLQLSRPEKEKGKEAVLSICENTGRKVFEIQWPAGSGILSIDETRIPQGTAIIQYQQDAVRKAQRLPFIR